MSEPVKINDEPEYVPDPEKEEQARAVHFTISIIRLLGVGLLVAGIVIGTGRLASVPKWPGYILIAIALFQMWFVPVWIIRQYVKARKAEAELEEAENQGDKS